MSDSKDEFKEDRSAFTDASYVSRSELPNMPKVYNDTAAGEKGSQTEREIRSRKLSLGTVAALCIVCLFLGAGLNELTHDGDKPAAAIPPVTVTEYALPHSDPAAGTDDPEARQRPEPPASEERAYMGVIVQTVSRDVADYYNQYNADSVVVGAQVFAVEEKSSADEAGLRTGDIITALNDREIRSAGDLTQAENAFRPGDSARLTFFRDGEYAEVQICFRKPDPAAGEGTGYFSFKDAW